MPSRRLRTSITIFTFLLLAALLLTLIYSPNRAEAQASPRIPTFILLSTGASAVERGEEVQAFIKANNGQTTHIFPGQALIATVSPDTLQSLETLPGVASVFTEAVDLATASTYGPHARRLAPVWNSLITPPAASEEAVAGLAAEHPEEHNDAFIAPDLPPPDKMVNLASDSVTPGYFQTSEFMAGSAAVGIVLLESNGATDNSTEDWTEAEKQQVLGELVAGLNWWAELEPRANLSFVYDDHFSQPLATTVEPITRPYHDQGLWIGDAMAAIGYHATSYFTRVRDYNNDLRDQYQTDWAFTVFVVDSSADADDRFSDGYFAYAYLGGPFMVMTSGNNGYGTHNMDAVAAHEVGHIFHALDQYYSAYQPCNRRSGYLHIENQNSQYGGCSSNVSSIMRGQIYPYGANIIDSYAAGQIGWRDSDGDNILDPLDTDLPVTIGNVVQDGNTVSVQGTAAIIPYPSPSQPDVTINKLTGVQYRFNNGPWQPAVAADGNFDSTSESYEFTATSLQPGLHTLEVAALDSAGNVSEVYAGQSVSVFDPVDGGLNTDIYPPETGLSLSSDSTLQGTAYHMAGSTIAGVEYRIDGGPWQTLQAQDGAFDSAFESFELSLSSEEFEPGAYLIEARAIDGDGNVEVNAARYQIEIKALTHMFLPILTHSSY